MEKKKTRELTGFANGAVFGGSFGGPSEDSAAAAAVWWAAAGGTVSGGDCFLGRG